LNEQTKTYLRVGGYIVIAAILVAIGWFLFRDIHSDGRTADDVTGQLNNVATEQQSAKKSLESVQSGLDDSQRTVDSLDRSNRDAQSTADGIAESNTNIANAVSDAQTANSSSTAVLTDSEQRITECQRIIQEIREGTRKATE